MIKALLFVALLTAASICDIRKREIPDIFHVLIVATGLIPPFSPVCLMGILAALPLLVPNIVKEGSIGGGDVKLMAAAGSFLGLSASLFSLFAGLLCAVLFHFGRWVIAKIRKREQLAMAETALPLAPFLSLGCVLSLIT